MASTVNEPHADVPCKRSSQMSKQDQSSDAKSLHRAKSSGSRIEPSHSDKDPAACPKTCPKHRPRGERGAAKTPPKKAVQYGKPYPESMWQVCQPCQMERNECSLCQEAQRLKAPAQMPPLVMMQVPSGQTQEAPQRKDSKKSFCMASKNHPPGYPQHVHGLQCEVPNVGNLEDVCEAYRQLQCKDTVWTVKIMKDSANTAKCVEKAVMVQTSMTTIISAKKLENMMPSEDRFLDDEQYMECRACREHSRPMEKFPPQQRHRKSVSRSTSKSDSSPSRYSCFCCRRRNKKRKRRTKRKRKKRMDQGTPPDLPQNCTENYIS